MPTTKSQLKAGLKVTDVQTQDSGLSSDQDVQRQQIADRANAVVKAPTSTITSETLSGNAKPLKLPPPTVQTLTTGTQDYISSQNQSVKTEQQKQVDLEKRQLDNQRNDITSLITDLGNSQGIKNELYKTEGVDTAKKQVDEYTSQLEAEQLSNTRRIQAIQKNPQGLFAGGMEQEVNRVNSESLTKQADLAILQNNALRKYSTAAEIADRAVEAKLEPMKAKLEALKFFYAENKADFDKKDDRAYAELIKQKDREYVTQKENVTKAFSSGLRNSYINEGGKVYRASDGKEYETPEEFYADAGVTSFDEAYSKGLVGDLTMERVADLDFVSKLRAEYYDAGISITDSAAEAVAKLSNSNKYLLESKDLYDTANAAPKIETINGQGYVYNSATGTYELLEVEGGANGGKPLSAEASKVLANTDSGLAAINEMTNMLNESGTVKIFAPNPFSQVRKQYFSSADNLVDIIGRMRSGGAITEGEEARFKSLLPKALDSQATWTNKLTQLKALLNGVKNGLSGNVSFNSAGNASDSSVKGFTGSADKLQPISFAKVVNDTYKPGTTPVSYGAKSNECGYYARQVVSRAGYTYPTLGDGLNSKIAAVQKYGVPAQQGNIGSVIVTRENPTYGHVAVILQKLPDGVIVTESNYPQSGKISNGRFIPYSKIVGAINPTKKA